MKKEIADKWIVALRSGEFKQTRDNLKFTTIDGEKRHCCLGVLCELAKVDGVCDEWIASNNFGQSRFSGSADLLPVNVMEWSGMVSKEGRLRNGLVNLANMNDTFKKSFSEIADAIEENWEIL